mmetsp:Transcript_15068/g.63549  ORF Transcript_15068/g.63549 Transcript_15068/m.63549 type:complete len:274 (-) Transcript_15068:507-1328(-)
MSVRLLHQTMFPSMKRLMSKSNALTPTLNVASVSIRNLPRRISARVRPGLMASRTCFTVRRFSSPIASRPVHTPTLALPKYMSGNPLFPPRAVTTVTCSKTVPSLKKPPPSGPSSFDNSSHTCALSASFCDAPSPARATMRFRFSLDTGIIRRFPGGNRRKSGTSTLPATSALPSIKVGSTESKPSERSISVIASVPIVGGDGKSARSNTGLPIGWSRPFARSAHATRNSMNPCPSLTACDMQTPKAEPPPFNCVTFAVNTGAPPSMMSIHGS